MSRKDKLKAEYLYSDSEDRYKNQDILSCLHTVHYYKAPLQDKVLQARNNPLLYLQLLKIPSQHQDFFHC